MFGEHAAVYGHPALGISLPWTVELKITPLAAGHPERTRLFEPVPPLPPQLAAMLALPSLAAAIEIRSQIPVGLGFGSSAALCVAAERALMSGPLPAAAGTSPAASSEAPSPVPQTAPGRHLDHPRVDAALPPAESEAAVWRGAHEREKVFHGTPSGADTGLATYPGIGFLSWAEAGVGLPSYEPVPAAELHLVVAAVPRRGDTKTHVSAVAERVRAGDTATRETLRRLGQCSREARALMLRPRLPAAQLGVVADAAQRLLAGLGLADPSQERLLHAGHTAGACGGKLSGAGGGGACFLICRDPTTAARVLAAIRDRAADAAHIVVAGSATRLADPASRSCTTDRWLHDPHTPRRSRKQAAPLPT